MLLNFTQYNYYIWAKYIKYWLNEDDIILNNVIDIGSGDGCFLKELLALGLISQATGVDIAPPLKNQNKLFFLKQDLLIKNDSLNLESYDAVFFMNMLYVLPDINNVINIFNQFDNIFISLPASSSLEYYNNRHPNNNYPRDIESFVKDIGGVIYKREKVCSRYYLKNPASVLLGGMNRKLAYSIENTFSKEKFYHLIWIKNKAWDTN